MDLVNRLEGRLLFAVPKKGRLQQSSLELLAGCSIDFKRSHRLDIALVEHPRMAIIFLPAADIPTFVGEGRVDLGITGRDQVAEHEAVNKVGIEDAGGIEEVMDLGFGSCTLKVQVPENGAITKSRELVGRNVVTSFTGLTERYFRGLEAEGMVNGEGESDRKKEKTALRTKIKYVGGSVEAACALGVADGIVDLVESGETMKAAGLKAIDDVLTSTAVLIKSKHPSDPKLVDIIASRIRGFIIAQLYVLCQYNIPRRLLPVARRITPGKRAPTVTALDGTGNGKVLKDEEKPETEEEEWVAVSSMVEKKAIATVMDQLTANGATDILQLKIDNTRTD